MAKTPETILHPFFVHRDGEPVAFVSYPKLSYPKFLLGTAVGGLAVLGGANAAHADIEPTTPVTEHLHEMTAEPGESPWSMMEDQGFTPQEIWRDIVLRHGIPETKAWDYVIAVGEKWTVHPDTIAEKAAREGNATDAPTEPADQDPVVDQPITTLETTVAESVVPAEPTAPSVPAVSSPQTESLVPSTEVAPATTTDALPETFNLNPGETIAGEVIEIKVEDPNGVIARVLEANNLTTEDAKNISTEDALIIPEDYRDEFAQRQNNLPETPEISSAPPVPGLAKAYLLGDSISVGMKNPGKIEEQAYGLGIDIDVNAEGGISLGNALKTVDIETLLAYNAVVIELGTNAPESDESFESTLRTFLTSLHETAFKKGIKAPMVYIVNLHEAEGANVKISDEDRNPIIGQIVYDYAAIGERIALIDWNEFATNNPFVYAGSDGIHPSDYPTMATYVLDQMRTLYKEPAVPRTEVFPVGEVIMPAGSYWNIAPDYVDAINNMELSEARKQFLIFALEAVMHEVASGKVINPRVALAQVIHETGWGTSYLAREGLNLFGYKATKSWLEKYPDRFVLVYDDEFDAQGNKLQSKFKKYQNLEESFADYASLINRADHYADARQCVFDDLGYANGLVHALHMDGTCSIGRMQGEDGVMSYATDKSYVDKLMSTISRNGLDKLIVVNEEVRQQILTQTWIAENGGL